MPIYIEKLNQEIKNMSLSTYRFGTQNIQNFSEVIDSAALKLTRQSKLVDFPEVHPVAKTQEAQENETFAVRSLNLAGMRDVLRTSSANIASPKSQATYFEEVNLNWNFSAARS